ncbi:glutamate formimidoyltransferase [Gaoshiqia sediminis]|uniref:Formimidoyltransferase-cyclodeaminase n=1 Tax=Gaoshiqia sediminis TaxID=2986998 RepID=A0AA41YA55_9BACT|nr:glutamate formimidoyltransferase [Gaoshiqia sediminis]MCW0484132.1 glutamate formimidoyltransferase [Gaoshiqia sediminis]
MNQLIECVPNFSEGRNPLVIKQITDAIEGVEGVKLLNVDPGKATNRTVVTFVGSPGAVVEAAFQAVKKAAEVIDMSQHHGEHPRFGATDVCPLVPVANISMEETAKYARQLAKRIGEELAIPVYCYEFAAQNEERRSLANCRSGEYEGLPQKLKDPNWQPDFGPAEFNAKSGATAVSARNFLIAYNVNLNTTSVRRANAVAFDVREAGRLLREGDPVTGKLVKDETGEPIRIPGSLKKVRAIGWFIEEYGIAQLSMNLTDITVTPVHVAFEEVCKSAEKRGMRVTGSELIGLIPLQAMLDAGKYFLRKQQRSTGIADEEIIKIAVKSMGLDELAPFDPKQRIIEYLLENREPKLRQLDLENFVNRTASEMPAPGGGSVSAYVGALGASLAGMVANLSAHKRGWDERWEEFSEWAEQAKTWQQKLLQLVDDDTQAFNQIMEAFDLPKNTAEEKALRSAAIQQATLHVIMVPLEVMETAFASMEVIGQMAERGNPNSVSDAGVGALCARTAVQGAYLNVLINLSGLDDDEKVKELKHRAEELLYQAEYKEQAILAVVYGKIN